MLEDRHRFFHSRCAPPAPCKPNSLLPINKISNSHVVLLGVRNRPKYDPSITNLSVCYREKTIYRYIVPNIVLKDLYFAFVKKMQKGSQHHRICFYRIVSSRKLTAHANCQFANVQHSGNPQGILVIVERNS